MKEQPRAQISRSERVATILTPPGPAGRIDRPVSLLQSSQRHRWQGVAYRLSSIDRLDDRAEQDGRARHIASTRTRQHGEARQDGRTSQQRTYGRGRDRQRNTAAHCGRVSCAEQHGKALQAGQRRQGNAAGRHGASNANGVNTGRARPAGQHAPKKTGRSLPARANPKQIVLLFRVT